MPDQQGSKTPSSATGSESLRASAAEFVPKLRATASDFVPTAGAAPLMYPTTVPMYVRGAPVSQRHGLYQYPPAHQRPEMPQLMHLKQASNGAAPMMQSMGQQPPYVSFVGPYSGASVPIRSMGRALGHNAPSHNSPRHMRIDAPVSTDTHAIFPNGNWMPSPSGLEQPAMQPHSSVKALHLEAEVVPNEVHSIPAESQPEIVQSEVAPIQLEDEIANSESERIISDPLAEPAELFEQTDSDVFGQTEPTSADQSDEVQTHATTELIEATEPGVAVNESEASVEASIELPPAHLKAPSQPHDDQDVGVSESLVDVAAQQMSRLVMSAAEDDKVGIIEHVGPSSDQKIQSEDQHSEPIEQSIPTGVEAGESSQDLVTPILSECIEGSQSSPLNAVADQSTVEVPSGGDPVSSTESRPFSAKSGELTAANTVDVASDTNKTLRYTIDEIMNLQKKFAQQNSARKLETIIAPAAYSGPQLMQFQFQSHCTQKPQFVNPLLDCIGSPASRQYGGGRERDRRQGQGIDDRRVYHQPIQRERERPVSRYEHKAKSREPSRSREFSRANFGHLQGTVKPIEDRDNRRRHEPPRDRFDGPVRAPDPVFEPLAHSENRYVVKKDIEGEELALRQVQSVLNKLTPEKFERLVTQLIDLIMNHLAHLEKLIGLVFDKAVNEYSFANMYGELCHCLNSRLSEQGNDVSRFREILLERCRAEFESRSAFPAEVRAIADEHERESMIFISRRRSRGLLTFIGNLFNRRLLHTSVIIRCMAQLAPVTSKENGRNIEWDIEDTCTIWGVVGKIFASVRTEDVQRVVIVSFQIIASMIESREVSSRSIFMMKDLVDLRSNRWEPRREVVVASTLADVHKKSQQEAMAKERAGQKTLDRRGGDDRDYRSQGGSRRAVSSGFSSRLSCGEPKSRPPRVDGDGWSQKVSKPKRPISLNLADTILNKAPAASAGFKPAVTVTRPAEPSPEVKRVKSNAFSCLQHCEDEEEEETTSGNPSANEGEPSSSEASRADQASDLNDDYVREKVRQIVKEFFSIEDYKEVMQSLDDLRAQSLHHIVVIESLTLASEGKPKDRELAPELLLHIFRQNQLSTAQITSGIIDFVSLLEDLEIDIPKIRSHTSDFIAALVLGDALPLSSLAALVDAKHVPMKTLQAIQSKCSAGAERGGLGGD